jgi:hypothetical protein
MFSRHFVTLRLDVGRVMDPVDLAVGQTNTCERLVELWCQGNAEARGEAAFLVSLCHRNPV